MHSHVFRSGFYREEQNLRLPIGFLDNIGLQKWSLLLKERVCSKGENSFLQE